MRSWGRPASRIASTPRVAMDADFGHKGEPPTPEPEPAQKVDQIEELMRIVGEQGKESPPRGPKAPPFQRSAPGASGSLARLHLDQPQECVAVAFGRAAHAYKTVDNGRLKQISRSPFAFSWGSYPTTTECERGGYRLEGSESDCDADHGVSMLAVDPEPSGLARRLRVSAAGADATHCYPNCYPTACDKLGRRTMRERTTALFSGQCGRRWDQARRRRPNFKTAALNHSAILP